MGSTMRVMTKFIAASAVLVTGACGGPGNAAPSGRNAPNLAACPAIKANAEADLQRKGAIPLPQVWSGIARTDRNRIAFSTLGGRTLCIDASWMEGIQDAELSADGRFARFVWYGNESGGYFVVDRSGKGQAFDTGDKPVPSPSGNLVAVVQYSEASFGSLEGFGVWRIDAKPMREEARLTLPEGLTGWRMEGWHGDACVPLSAVRFDDLPQNEAEERSGTPRQYFVAMSNDSKWRIVRGEKGTCR